MDIFPPSVQRPALLQFARSLGCRRSALRQDECGDWRINGRYGHIYAVQGGYQLYFGGPARGWFRTKEALKFASVTQDGDVDGCLFLDRHPTMAEANLIRERLGISKRRTSSEREIQRLRDLAIKGSYGRQEPAPESAKLLA
jgi:hypothetical protein